MLGAVNGGAWEWSTEDGSSAAAGAGGLLFVGPLLMIVFRQKYPRWWFDWNLELQRFANRVGAYLALMDDRYPSTDEEQSVHLNYQYPDVPRDLNRWLPLFKWALAIPHYIVLAFLNFAADNNLADCATSASPNTSAGACPPSSIVTRFIWDPARAASCLPTWVEPVKEILRMMG